MTVALTVLAALSVGARHSAAEPPALDHQPSACTIPDKPVTLCASITDDGQVAKSRIYFKPAGDKYYNFVDMAFGGLSFCGTLPAPRGGKLQAIDYYVQAVDDAFDSNRTPTYQITIQPEGVCEFPPVEKDSAKAITVYATHQKQGKKLPQGFQGAGVTFVPVKGS
jgi:hypothetical protein